MNTRPKTKPLKARFRTEVRFPHYLEPADPNRAKPATDMDRLTSKLLEAAVCNETDAKLKAAVQRAAHEAASIAWYTSFPLLVLPTLFEEKVQNARRQHTRQVAITRRCRGAGGKAA